MTAFQEVKTRIKILIAGRLNNQNCTLSFLL
jgi:hypothetical protein